MPTSVELLRIAARTFQTGGDDEDLGIAALIRALHEDLEATSSRADTLQGLLDILCATDGDLNNCLYGNAACNEDDISEQQPGFVQKSSAANSQDVRAP